MHYTNADFCKKNGKSIQNPSTDRNYFGLALLYKGEIDECNCDIHYTPQENNPYHSDIKIGYVPERGEPLPSEFQKKVKKLTEKSRLFEDPNPNSDVWEGDNLE